MYNRYIPSEDGSYRKHSMPEPPPPPPGPPAPRPPEPPRPKPGQSLGAFFGGLLPASFDTEDLIVVLLLLLMSQDCKDGPNTPLITMLIYLFS